MLKRVIEGAVRGVAYLRESRNDTVLNVRAHVQVDKYSCGMQSLASVLDYYDYHVDFNELTNDICLTQDGCDEDQLRKAIRAYGLGHRSLWRMSMTGLRACIDAGHPVIVIMNKNGHWAVVYGYGDESVYVMDPSIGRALKYAGKWPEQMFRDRWNKYGIEIFEKARKRTRTKSSAKKK